MEFLKALFSRTSSNSATSTNTGKSIGHALLEHYKPFIGNKEAAKKAALSVLWHGKTQFIESPGGEFIRASDSAIPLPRRLQLFSDKFYGEEKMIISHEVVDLTYQLTRTIDNQTAQIETIYSIAEAIVEKHGL